MKSINLFIILIILFISGLACEKDQNSPGHGAFGYQILSMGLNDWGPNEVKVVSGSKGVIIDGLVRGGGLKSAKVIMIDTVSNKKLYEKMSNTLITDIFRFQDTIIILKVLDTIYAKITIEGIDENEMNTVHRRLKIID